MPELRNANGTQIGNRSGILIHNGVKGEHTRGCLHPGELENRTNPIQHKPNTTLLKTMQLTKILIEHDIEAYKNYYDWLSKTRQHISFIKDFLIVIKDDLKNNQ